MPKTIFQTNTNELENAHVGPALIFMAPYGTTFPDDLDDIVNVSGSNQWQPKTGWSVLGATKTGIKIERGFTKVDRSSDQSFGPFDSRPNGWTAMVSSELLETTPTNIKIAWEGGAVSTIRAGEDTTLSANAAAAATSFTVAAAGTLASGDLIIVGNNATQEWHTVTLVSGTTIGIHPETLAFAQPSGTPLLKPGKTSQGFGHMRSNTPRLLAVVAPLVKVSDDLLGNIELVRTWAFRITRLGEGNKTINLSQENDWTIPVSFHAYRDPNITDEQIDTFMQYDLTLA